MFREYKRWRVYIHRSRVTWEASLTGCARSPASTLINTTALIGALARRNSKIDKWTDRETYR